MKKRVVALSGAGVSAESGIRTFRDNGGLWEEHSIYEVATPDAWQANPELVLRFYNDRRTQLAEVEPNAAHLSLAKLEEEFEVTIVTQNVDNLHERAGSTKVIHLHGELTKVRSTLNPSDVKDIGYTQIKQGDCCGAGAQLRPHIVWFGEEVPMMEEAMPVVQAADILIIIGTSLNVYPAAGLHQLARPDCPIFLIDPDPSLKSMESSRITVISEKAGIGMPELAKKLGALN